MYIWILLASIMVALSFFNVNPRNDKDNSLSEIKASSIISRLMVEHKALFHMLNCVVALELRDSNQNPLRGNDEINKNTIYGNFSLSKNLPLGYELKDIKHHVICLDNRIIDGGKIIPCRESGYRYGLSYVPIPDRWIDKEDNTKPLPAFLTYIGGEVHTFSTYGWVICDGGRCEMRGFRSHHYSKKHNRYETIHPDSEAWNVLKSQCETRPCLVAYKKLKTADAKGNCQAIQTGTNN